MRQDGKLLDQLLLGKLRNEVGELKKYQHQCYRQQEETARLEAHCLSLLQGKQRIQQEHQQVLITQQATADTIQSEINGLSIQLQRLSLGIEQAQADNQRLRDLNQSAARQLRGLIDDNRALGDQFEALAAQTNYVGRAVTAKKQEAEYLQRECQHMSSELQSYLIALRSIEKQLEVAEMTQVELKEALNAAVQDSKKIGATAAAKRAQVQGVQIRMQQLERQIEREQGELQQMEQLLQKKLADQELAKQQLWGEEEKAQKLRVQVMQMEEAMTVAEREFFDLTDREQLIGERMCSIMRQNQGLQVEVDKRANLLKGCQCSC